jgi:soluble lytic murein transglycosylase
MSPPIGEVAVSDAIRSPSHCRPSGAEVQGQSRGGRGADEGPYNALRPVVCSGRRPFVTLAIGLCCLAAVDGRLDANGQAVRAPLDALSVPLRPTAHPPLPDNPTQFWLVPAPQTSQTGTRPVVDREGALLAQGVDLFEADRLTAALTLLGDTRLNASRLGNYARYYRAWARLKLDRLAAARLDFTALATNPLEGYLSQAVAIRRAELDLAARQHASAVHRLAALSAQPLLEQGQVLLKLANAYELAGDRGKAIATYRRVWVDFVLIPEGNEAGEALQRLERPRLRTTEVVRLELERAERLFTAKRWAPAREAFRDVLPVAGTSKRLVEWRIAQCEYGLKRHTAAKRGAEPFATAGPYRAEARFVVLAATRGLKQADRFKALVREMVTELPSDRWTEEALNLLASHHLIADQDREAAETFQQLIAQFPGGRYAERAHWKSGWFAYRAGNDDEAVRFFEAGAARMPRANFRPAWLYWAGRAHERQGRTAEATSRYRLALTDYQHSYYGRLAERRLDAKGIPAERLAVASAPVGVPTEALIRDLVAAGLFGDAGREIRYAQRVWGDSPALQATLAWVKHKQAANLVSWERFNFLRGAINQMKRAYPQYIAAGGRQLPAEALGVIFPLDYWTLIERHATAYKLDPYLMAALIQQESTFTADVRSGANAYGLMQLIPATARRYAKKVGLGQFSVRLLTRPEPNIRMGMAYFKDLSDRFGGAHFAIASYNAGPSRVSRWRGEKPNLPDDEFIDDIPFPETHNYVKKVLGMAEEYRRLYGGGLLTPAADAPHATQVKVKR